MSARGVAPVRRLKDAVKARWPALRLRAILFGVLLFTAAMPGLGAVFLRVYENVLVRQTEAELIAQAAALEAALRQAWPGVRPAAPEAPRDEDPVYSRRDVLRRAVEPRREAYYQPEPLTVDLNAMPTLPERPAAVPPAAPPDPDATQAAAAVAAVVRDTVRATLASIRVLDRNGVVVLGREEVGLSHANLDEVRQALAGTPVTVLRRRGDYAPRYPFEVFSRASDLRIHYARPVRVDGQVVGALLTSRSPRGLFRGVYDDLGKIALGVGVIFAVIVLLAALLSRSIARPIAELSEATKRVAAGRSRALEPPALAAVEIRALFQNFGRMSDEIDRRSRYLRDFAAAMSHEFKTPLAGIRGALELLEEHGAGMEEADRRRFLANASADAARLSRLVGKLLELARADMARPGEAAEAGLEPPMRRVADALGGARLGVDVALSEPGLASVVPAEVIEAVLTTLAENAAQAGAKRVAFAARPSGDAALLEVSDDGAGVPPADRERLFEPFFTTRRADGGAGLGLAIARSLLAAHGAAIDLLEAEPNAGARFRLTLPRRSA